VTSWIVVALLVVVARGLRRSGSGVPRGTQNLAEAIIERMLGFADAVTGDRALTIRFFPFVASFFFFILLSNWFGLLPIVGPVGVWGEHGGETTLIPLFRSASADLNFTLALAAISVVAAQVYGMRALGPIDYWRKFFVPPWRPPYGIGTFVGLLEFISEFAKVISFSFRLFGNVFAGEVLLLAMAFLAPLLAPVPFLFLEIFVGVVQATVFSMLTLVFLTIAVSSHDGEEHARGASAHA
jgi:F-type H+-transporting ATPase subunit a